MMLERTDICLKVFLNIYRHTFSIIFKVRADNPALQNGAMRRSEDTYTPNKCQLKSHSVRQELS